MNKFAKATKKIAAVATVVTMASSAAFAGGVNYPTNFVKNGAFAGQVIIGASATADMAAATSVVEDLKADFSGSADKVKITATKSTGTGDSVSILDSGNVMKFGQDLNDVKSTDFDDKDISILADGTFKNGASDEDYEQYISMKNNGFFERSLRDDQENELSTHLWLEDTNVADYKFAMKSSVSFDGTATDWDSDFVGKSLNILGNDYTIVSAKDTVDSNGKYGFSELELVGGANKISLGEGETTTVTIDGVSYNVGVQSVAAGSNANDGKVLLTINGETKSVDELDTEEIGGVNVAVTDLVASNRDSVKGYAEIVLGGNKIKLTDGAEIKLNDEDISDIYDNYGATVTFQNSGTAKATSKFDGFTIAYSLDDEMLLQKGDSWNDNVFNAFSIRFDGTNEPEYKQIKLSASSDKLAVEGTLLSSDSYNEDVARLYDDTQATTTPTVLLGASDDDRMLVSNFAAVSAADFTDTFSAISVDDGLYLETVTDSADDASTDSVTINGQTFTNVADGTDIEVGNYIVTVNEKSTWAQDTVNLAVKAIDLKEAKGMRFITGDTDDQQIYEFGTYSVSADEVDFTNIINDDSDDNIAATAIASKLDDLTHATSVANSGEVTALDTLQSQILFDNQYIVDLQGVASAATTNSAGGYVEVYTDSTDLNADVETGDNSLLSTTGGAANDNGDFPAWTFNLRLDATDDMFDVELDKTKSNEVLLSGAKADVTTDNDNVKEYVDTYGTIVKVDAEDKEWVEISTPDKQVEAQVSLVAGDAGSDVKTYTVDASAADAKVAELKADGYTTTTENVAASSVAFDVTTADIVKATEGMPVQDAIVVGGPAVNAAARTLLGVDSYNPANDAFVKKAGDAVARYFADSNSVLVYGYTAADTVAVTNKLNDGTVMFK